MRDVADLAGVSTQTVSNFVNGRTAKLAPPTRTRVQQAIDDLGYRFEGGRAGNGRRRTLGFLVLDDSERFLADPLTALYLSGFGEVARAHGFSVLVHSSSDADGRLLRPVIEKEVAAACLLLSGPRARRMRVADRVAASGIPFVLFDEVLPGSRAHYPTVLADQRDGARALVHHLVRAGHRRIAFVAAASEWAVLEERYAGYRTGQDECGLAPDSALTVFEGGWEPVETAGVVDDLMALPDPPTALVCGSDLVALSAIHHLLDRGIAVPDQVAVCGFDDFAFSSHARPSLTTVAVPAWDMGRAAARMMLWTLQGRVITHPEVRMPVQMILRDSA
jgi:DNA-binding LacI/PurR family transcriptional regulator